MRLPTLCLAAALALAACEAPEPAVPQGYPQGQPPPQSFAQGQLPPQGYPQGQLMPQGQPPPQGYPPVMSDPINDVDMTWLRAAARACSTS